MILSPSTATPTSTLVATAPGKLVLCGEYAVVDGSPAVVAAVSRRARATWQAGPGLRLRGNDPRWLEVDDRVLAMPCGASEQPLLLAVLQELRRRGLALPEGALCVDTSPFTAAVGKLGLGSSAAAAAAFTALCLAAGGRTDAPPPELAVVHDVARAAHRAFQGGGSGIDVAAASYGGVLVFEQGQVRPAPSLPPSLALVVAFTGKVARTQGFVDAWRALGDRAAHRAAIGEATARFLAGAQSGSAPEVLSAVDEAREAMAAMGRQAGIDVVTVELARIAQLTHRRRGASKPSGAGGGDIAVCLVPHDARAALEHDLEAAGFPVVPLALDPAGVALVSP